MSNRRKQLALSMFVQRLESESGPESPRNEAPRPQFDEWLEIVQLLERGKFDLAFFADFVGSSGIEPRGPGGGRGFDPLTLLSALAVTTQNIGLVATVNTNLSIPYTTARQLASIDHLSGGRSGWNIVSSLSDGAKQTFGLEDWSREQRYERAAEYVDLTKKLWDSWQEIPGSPRRQHHPVHHHGANFRADALLDIARPLQGYPVFFQAGASEAGREFAAQYAELIYAAAQTLEDAQAFYSDVKNRLAKYGREPEHLIVSLGLFFHVGSSRQEAEERHEQFLEDARPKTDAEVHSRFAGFFGVDIQGYNLDGPLPEGLPDPENNQGRWHQAIALAKRENLTPRQLVVRFTAVQGHRTVIGTPADIADQLEDWFLKEGADGYNLKPWRRENLVQFIDKVVPELQKRGIFRKDYTSPLLRDHLALPYPYHPAAR